MPTKRVVYAKRPFAGSEAVLAYLSRYKTMTLKTDEFIRRFAPGCLVHTAINWRLLRCFSFDETCICLQILNYHKTCYGLDKTPI